MIPLQREFQVEWGEKLTRVSQIRDKGPGPAPKRGMAERGKKEGVRAVGLLSPEKGNVIRKKKEVLESKGKKGLQ